jgi:predicted O-linked N-acetylglucosamine transferase (SPINDLY family)
MDPLLTAALAHLRAGQYPEAQALYETAVAADGDNPAALHGLGIAFLQQNRHEEAAKFLGRAAALKPGNAGYHLNLGAALHRLRKLDEAITAFRRALALKPDYPQALSNLATLLEARSQVEEAVTLHNRAVQLRPDDAVFASNRLFALHYHPRLTSAELFQEHRRWDERFGKPPAGRISTYPNKRDPARPLRVGYVSADFRRHSVGYFFAPLLANHDRAVVEPYCYSGVINPDDATAEFRRNSSGFRDIAALSDDRLVELIRADGIDILVDLSGHTAGNRLTAFARKPAPVQVTYLGYPNTTGLAAIDYRLTDAIADPPGLTEALNSEQLVRLPDCAWCFQPSPDAPDPRPRDDGPIIFGSFNALPKLTEQTMQLFALVLHRVPGSRLLLKSHGLADDAARRLLLDRMAALGIDGNRIELIGYIESEREHMALYHRMDIALDSFPYHGTTTTCQAIWMGVPVISLAGDSHRSRVGASLLSSVGLQGLIAQTPEEYAAIASNMAADLPALDELRQNLRGTMRHSPLMDGPRFARNIESAYRRMWEVICLRD